MNPEKPPSKSKRPRQSHDQEKADISLIQRRGQSPLVTSSHDDPWVGPEKASFNRMIDGFIAASPSYPPLNERALEPNDVFHRQDLLHRYMQNVAVATSLPSSTTLEPFSQSTSMAEQQLDPLPFSFARRALFRPSSNLSLNERYIQSRSGIHGPNQTFPYMQQQHAIVALSRRSQSASGTATDRLPQHLQQDMPFHAQRLPPRQLHMGQPAQIVTSRMLYQPNDDSSLSQYQCVVRQQIELFAADETDVHDVGAGRAGSIALGQVGLRCRHCAHLPPSQRARGSTAYPTRLDVLYQTAQNLAKMHLELHCFHINKPIREVLKSLREQKLPSGRGKQYWAESARELGVTEYPGGLRFASSL